MHIVIRAGGSGTRLWPMSRRTNPKQFQSLISESSLLGTTFGRVKPLSQKEGIWVSVNASLLEKARHELPEIASEHFIIEPSTRNTGPAICLEACFLETRLDPSTIIASLPSDDYISDQEAFRSLLKASEEFIKGNPEYIVAPAVKPDYPETGYSYLEAGERLDRGGDEAMFEVKHVAEKPSLEKAEELIASGRYYWHTGMYVWRLGRIIELFEQKQPAMVKVCREIVAGGNADRYSELEKLSIESAVINQADSLAMSVSNRLGWSDVGKWPSVKRLSEADTDGNVARGAVEFNRSSDNLAYSLKSGKLIVLNGVRNLAVIDTDDVLLISDLDETEAVKDIIAKIEKDHPNYA